MWGCNKTNLKQIFTTLWNNNSPTTILSYGVQSLYPRSEFRISLIFNLSSYSYMLPCYFRTILSYTSNNVRSKKNMSIVKTRSLDIGCGRNHTIKLRTKHLLDFFFLPIGPFKNLQVFKRQIECHFIKRNLAEWHKTSPVD